MTKLPKVISGVLLASLVFVGFNQQREVVAAGVDQDNSYQIAKADSEEDKALLQQANIFFKPLPKVVPQPDNNLNTINKVDLGKKLFFDPRLSKSGVISCNSCHNIATYGADNVETSLGHKFQTGGRNAPTVMNAGLHFLQFWDGRAADLEEQAKGPILNPLEMAVASDSVAVETIKSIEPYVKQFKQVFPKDKDPVTYDNISKAIASFERTLVTPSRFDKFLNGDLDALTMDEKKGLRTFINKGCIACHQGAAMGGSMFQKFGVVEPYQHQKDKGRFEVTGEESDMYVFKVPSLRNIANTAPYFHDGKVWDLGEAVKTMGRTQLGLKLSNEETNSIVTFLKSLTGTIPQSARVLPVLPPSEAKTPKPGV